MADNEENRDHTLMVGATTGAAVGTVAAAATVPIIQAVGFTASGIAANSAAAAMMSSAALAGGGGVASGSAVAVCQSIGALGAAPLAMTAATVAIPASIGFGIAAFVKTYRNGQHESLDAQKSHQKLDDQCWIIATEEGWGNVRICRYSSEQAARKAFNSIWCSRVLYNANGDEIQSAGLNGWAIQTIRLVMKEKYFSG